LSLSQLIEIIEALLDLSLELVDVRPRYQLVHLQDALVVRLAEVARKLIRADLTSQVGVIGILRPQQSISSSLIARMKIRLENTREEISSLGDLKKLIVKNHEGLRDFSAKRCTSLRHRVRDGPMINVCFDANCRGRGDFYVEEPLLFVEEEGELYVQSDSLFDAASVDESPVCAEFPLAWHEKECALNVEFSQPKNAQSIVIGIKDQNGERTMFKLHPNSPLELSR